VPTETKAGNLVFSQVLRSLKTNDAPLSPRVSLVLFAADVYVLAIKRASG
jgi:hypothetical protein